MPRFQSRIFHINFLTLPFPHPDSRSSSSRPLCFRLFVPLSHSFHLEPLSDHLPLLSQIHCSSCSLSFLLLFIFFVLICLCMHSLPDPLFPFLIPRFFLGTTLALPSTPPQASFLVLPTKVFPVVPPFLDPFIRLRAVKLIRSSRSTDLDLCTYSDLLSIFP